MRHDFFDRYSRLDSVVQHWPAVVKLIGALAVVLITVVLPGSAAWGLGAIAVGLIGISVASRIPALFLIKRLLFLEPFVVGVAVLAAVQPGGGKIFVGIVVKSTLCLFAMILLSNTTPFSELLRLLQRAHVPALFVTTLALMYRYLFVLIDETERMQRARASRTFSRRRRHVWRSLATVIGQLFVRSSERAERIYAAMCARGWK